MDRNDYNILRKLYAEKNKKDLITFKYMLETHDWHWRMSDSSKVREKGEREEDSIKSF